jgi:hypothetical protein
MSLLPEESDELNDELDIGATIRGLRSGLQVFGRYTLKRQLGRGGMGVVWLAQDARLELEVALKFLPENLVHDEAALDDLRQETRRCMKLSHTNIVRVHDLVDDGTTAAIVMEYVEGKTLSALRLEKATKVFEADEIMVWLRQVCEALDYAHTEGRLVHRDLKPSNLMITSHGQVKVMDFGIASSLGDSMSRMSRAGAKASTGGTLPYMSPQQVLGLPTSVADDVYSLGATLYELLTGKPPFYTGSLERQIETMMPPTLAERREHLGVGSEVAVPALWEEVISKSLEKEAEKRPLSTMAFWRALDGQPLETGEGRGLRRPQPAKPPVKPPLEEPARQISPALLAGSIVAVVLLLVAGWWVGVEGPRRQTLLAAAEERAAAAVAGQSAAESTAAKLTGEKAAAEDAAAIAAAKAMEAEKEKQELLAKKAQDELEALKMETAAAEAKRKDAAAQLLAAQQMAAQQEANMAAEKERLRQEAEQKIAEAEMAANKQTALKTSLETFIKSHLRTYASDSSNDWAAHFADYSDYQYYDKGRAPRSFIANDRAKYIKEYSVRNYEILNNNTFKYDMNGSNEAEVTYSYSYAVRGGSKYRSGKSSVTLTVELEGGSWQITSFHERVLKN